MLECPGDSGAPGPLSPLLVFYCILLCPGLEWVGIPHQVSLRDTHSVLKASEHLVESLLWDFGKTKTKIQKAMPLTSPEAKKPRARSLFKLRGEKRKEKHKEEEEFTL